MLESPLFMQGNTYAARRMRELVGYLFDVEGVINPGSGALQVAPRAAGANMSIDIPPGACAILGDDAAGQGMYVQPSTAVENKPIGAAPGSNSRIDLVYAQLRDAAVTGGVSSDWLIEVLPGAVAAAPVEPALPASAIRLGAVTVAAGTVSITAAMITDRRTAAANAAYVLKTSQPGRAIGAITAGTETTTQTDYYNTAPLFGPDIVYVAPPSGQVMVEVSATVWSDSAVRTCWLSYEVVDLTDNSTLHVPTDSRAFSGIGATAQGNASSGSRLSLVTSHVPGRRYRATVRGRVSFGTGSFNNRRLTVIPI